MELFQGPGEIGPTHARTLPVAAFGVNPIGTRLVKVQRYFNALTVTEREERALATQGAIAGLTEVLTVLTAQMRTSPGDFIVPLESGGFIVDVGVVGKAKGVIKEFAHGEAGDMKIKFVDPQAAAKALLAHYTDRPPASGGNVTVGTVIASLPPGVVAALWRAMALASGRQPVALLGAGQ